VHFTAKLLRLELWQRLLQEREGWNLLLARNRWFQKQAVRALHRYDLLADRPVVFAYSYAARDIFRAARAAGCTTILGQIDPAIAEENIVAEAVARHQGLAPRWQRAPAVYWQRWREECALADHVIVNSEWSRRGLVSAGIAADKLRVVPLAYDSATPAPARTRAPRFDAARPLRLLFLGSFILRKGAAELLEAARLLRDAPVEFHIVGGSDLTIAEPDRANPKLILHGSVPRDGVDAWFNAADVFILPTLSDGFGMTMLEAQSHGLPVIASRNCGNVVRDGIDGLLLERVAGQDIAASIKYYCENPALLVRQSVSAHQGVGRFTPPAIVKQLLRAAGEPCGF
jgi:glycosyltransferase involved in cell wall biosynthesis